MTRALALSTALALASCTGLGEDMFERQPPPKPEGTPPCTPARSSEPIPLLRSAAGATVTVTFDQLKARIDERCARCHVGMHTGGFEYFDDYAGLSADADRMATMLLAGRMPPNDPDPEGSKLLGLAMQAWIQAGRPQGAFSAPASTGGGSSDGSFPRLNPVLAEGMTNLASCIPDPDSTTPFVAPDPDKDRFFANATELPRDLADTDLTTFDAAVLATKGVFAYVPTYQLWSDEAHKLRMVRVPKGQKIIYDATTRTFSIPPNTRFYKTFFKRVVEPGGHIGYRAIETRLIVSRPSAGSVETAIFGTYVWDDEQKKATLWDGNYRDGTPFRDLVFQYTDEFRDCHTASDGSDQCDAHQHTYAIPAKHRCIQCHEGAEGKNFVLGFTPLQINRRAEGEGGLLGPVGEDELTQVERLMAYGVVEIAGGATSLPKLEASAGDRLPRTEYELQAQAYMVGNCAHCHNPNGFPVRDEPRLRDFNLAPGGAVFGFPLKKVPISTGLAYLVDPYNLNLSSVSASIVLRRVATPVTSVWSDANNTAHLVVPHMPANTPGMDCRAGLIIGKWIASIPVDRYGNELPPDAPDMQVQVARAAAEARVANFPSMYFCAPPEDVDNWVPEDLTEPKDYTPRRSDWNTWDVAEDGIDPFVHPDQIHGIPRVFRELVIDDAVRELANAVVPYGFWTWKSSCRFPVELPPEYVRPWMLTSYGQPRRPLGEVFLETPGAAIFRAVCSNCHGARADGNSGNAKALLQLSGGNIRVANLMQGLFGGDHRMLFDQPGPNGLSVAPYGAAKYLVWMASGGTSVHFPEGFETLLGTNDRRFGGNMLTKVSYYCSRLLPSQFWIGELRGDVFQNGIPDEQRELWLRFCSFRNQPVPDPNNIPTTFDATSWLHTAQFNGGLMMFFFFNDKASQGLFPPSADHCEQVFP